MSREAAIHFNLFHHLKNAIDKGLSYHGITFTKVEAEYPVDRGEADLVLFDQRGRPFLVLEAKRETRKGYDRNFDPYSPVVIQQAFRYAGNLGADYFATYNGKVLVIFRTFERGKHLLERKTIAYKIRDLPSFAPELLKELAALHTGVKEWDPRHRAFIGRLREFHSRLSEEYLKSLKDELANHEFKDKYKKWMEAQGWDPSQKKDIVRFVTQAAYLLMNKLVFYKTLQIQPKYPIPRLLFTYQTLKEDLEALFKEIVDKIDFEAVYEHDPIFDEVPLTERAAREVHHFLEELKEYDLTRFNYDVIGEIYQGVISVEERHDLGQYYTPPEITDLICKLTIRSSDDKVLDPACGSGSFLIAAYNRLKQLPSTKKESRSTTHKEILSQLYGIDINRFPAHLSAINLALRDLEAETRKVNVEVADFFNVIPQQKRVMIERVSLSGLRLEELDIPPKVNAVVANPPYIRQEILDKDLCRKHLSNIKTQIRERADIYVYFFTHATEFLEERGRIGFITSNRWLSVGYGEDLQKFFLNNFKVIAIIEFNKQVFDIPLIGTCVTILEKCDNQEERDLNIVKLITVKRHVDVNEIISIVQEQDRKESLRESKFIRIVKIRQDKLAKEDKWNRFFHAPHIYWDIVYHDKMTKLEDLCEIKYGIKTGANDFFYFQSQEELETSGIEKNFVLKVLKHVAQTEYIELRESDLSWYVLNVHDFVERALKEALEAGSLEGKSPSGIIKAKLKDEGYTGLLSYIRMGEIRKIPQRASVRNRRVWFDLGPLDCPPLVFPEVYWRRAPTLLNVAGVPIDKRLYSIYPRKGVDDMVLLGILNSSLTLLMREMHGRTEQGEAMNRNTIMVYEAKKLPIPDPRRASKEERSRISEAMKSILENERSASKEELKMMQRELDKAVLAMIGIEDRVDELQEAVDKLVKLRESGGGLSSEVLVIGEEEEEETITELRGAEIDSERQARISDF